MRGSSTRARLCLFAALTMCYGWGWRGVYGHEAGAMVPGALLGVALCIGSGRPDWHRRSAAAGLCGAIGWAWGGTLTNMEHRLYILSDAPLDVIYGFSCIGLIGLLWCGVGGACLAFAFTRPRSELHQFIGPLTAVGIAFLSFFLYFSLFPEQKATYEAYTEEHWHDGEWLAALTLLLVLAPYWILRRADRAATGVLLLCTVAWWIGYLGLTKFGGLELAPPYRSESWGGVVGVQVALLAHHFRRGDRAAVLFTLYSMLGGCIAFVLALQIHVPFVMDWGIFNELAAWKIAEESFGFFMGLGVAFGASRLLGDGLAAPAEDRDRKALDTFAAFVLLVVVMWMNLKRNVIDWQHRYFVLPEAPFSIFEPPFPQPQAWHYFFFAGLFWTALVLYCLVKAHRGRLALTPKTAVEKGALLFVLIVAISLSAMMALRVPDWKRPSAAASGFSMIVLAAGIIWLALSSASRDRQRRPAARAQTIPPGDRRWRVGWKYWALWAWVPVHILLASALALHIVEAPWRQDQGKERHRFGPKATWRVEAERRRTASLPKPIDFFDADTVAARRPLLIAHRGGVVTSGTPECSLGALRLAAASGYDLVELDIRESRDQVPTVFHDSTLEEACGRSESLGDLDAAVLQATLYRDSTQRIATLAQALAECRELGLGVMLDIKTRDGSDVFFETIRALLTGNALERSTLVMSRDPRILRQLPNLPRRIDEELLASPAPGRTPRERLDGEYWFGLPEALPDDKIARLKDLGVLVIPAINTFRYPAERHEALASNDIRRLLTADVDGFQIDSVYEAAFGIAPPAHRP